MQTHIIYHETTPFSGYILPYSGRIDKKENPGMAAYLESIAKEDPGAVLQYLPAMDVLPDPEKIKWDAKTSMLVPLDEGDITPAMAAAAAADQVADDLDAIALKDISYSLIDTVIDGMFTYESAADIDSAVDSAANLDDLKIIVRVCAVDILALRDLIKNLLRLALIMLRSKKIID